MSQPLPPKSLGSPTAGRLEQVWIGAVGVTLAWTFQLVAQRASSKGEGCVGRPVFQRKMLESCHPPRIASATRLGLLIRALPLPNGICHTAAALMLCRTSKSELA